MIKTENREDKRQKAKEDRRYKKKEKVDEGGKKREDGR